MLKFNDREDVDNKYYYKDNPDIGTAGLYELYTRISFVCYLREKLINCPDDIDPQYFTKSGHGKIVVE